MAPDDELRAFKAQVNLTEYAASRGYRLDPKASSRGSAAMIHPNGDKILVSRSDDGHWIYFSVRDSNDNGTIIDFVQRRDGASLGEVRRVLRPWIGKSTATRPPVPASFFVQRLQPVARDLSAVRTRFATMGPAGPDHPYLTRARGIPTATLEDPAFVGCIRTDTRGNAAFPHFNDQGLCGYEIKGPGYTGFASGGTKGLWSSRSPHPTQRLVVAETAIDALSYAALKGTARTRFVSIAGQMNPDQPRLLEREFAALADGSEVILAFDSDKAGDRLAKSVSSLFGGLRRRDLALLNGRPECRGADWNDILHAARGPPPSSATSELKPEH